MFDEFIESILNQLREAVLGLGQTMFDVYNSCCSTAISMLGIYPDEFADGKGWEIVTSVWPISLAVAGSLVSLFLMINFCRSSVDIREEIISMNTIWKIFLKVCFAEAILSFSLKIVQELFHAGGNLAILIGGEFNTVTISDEYSRIVEEAGMVSLIVALLMNFIGIIVSAVLGFLILYTVYSRFYRCLIIAPLAAPALTTIAGGNGVSQTATAYIKTLIACTLEAGVISLTLAIASALIGEGIDLGIEVESNILALILYPLEGIIDIGIVVGAVKSSEMTVRRALGL